MTERALIRVLWSAIALTAALAVAVQLGLTGGADLAATQALQRAASYPLDVATNLHTYLGLSYVTSAAACLAATVLWWRGRRGLAVAVLFMFLTAPVELALKLGLRHPGPPEEYVRAFAYLGPGFSTPSSFPSGHVARLGFFCALALLSLRSGGGRALAALALLLTMAARVYLGDHWASDVLGGTCLGVAAASAGLLAARRIDQSAASTSPRVRGRARMTDNARQSAASKSSFARRK